MSERVLVVFHLYYHNQISYFINKMKNITGVEWDLIVTGNNLNGNAVSTIRQFKPDAQFMQTDNVGYDIWPFIQCIKTIDLSKYLYVIKLHTKNEDMETTIHFNGIRFRGNKWVRLMVDALLANQMIKFFILRVNNNTDIAKHGFRSCCSDIKSLIAINNVITEIVHLSFNILMNDFNVG